MHGMHCSQQFMHLCSIDWQLVFIARWNQPYYAPVNHNAVGRLKDTATNLKSGQGFAMNIISEVFVENANVTAIDTPLEFEEWALSSLTKEKCVQNKSLASRKARDLTHPSRRRAQQHAHPRARQVLPCTFLSCGCGLGFLVCFSFFTTSGSLPATVNMKTTHIQFFFKFWCIRISVTMIPVLWETLIWVLSVLVHAGIFSPLFIPCSTCGQREFEHSYTKALQINVCVHRRQTSKFSLSKGMSERRIVDEFDK
ncbi:hypothetical protein BDR06DRAFT_953220 [Suillus hirtellus]|nr:hypothetical protein BDR06DRAFT_953220 [Suillus hirtellus]